MELLRDPSRWLAPVLGAALLATGAGARDAEPARGALRLAWRIGAGRALGSALAVADGRVAIGTREHECLLVDLESGAVLWRAHPGAGTSGGVALARDAVLGVSDGSQSALFCLERADGRERWRARFGEAWCAPVAGDSSAYAASIAGEVRAFAIGDGGTRWSYTAPAAVRAPLALAAGLVLVPTQGDSLIALDAATGEVRWSLSPGGALYGPIVVAGGRAWCLSYDGAVTAFDVPSGKVQGRGKCEGIFRAGLAGPDPLLALSTGGRLYALDPHSLEVRWQRDLGAVGDVTPVVDREMVWAGTQDGTLRLLRSSDGREISKLSVRAPVTTAPLAAGPTVVIGAGRGEVVAYRWFGGWRSAGLPVGAAFGIPWIAGPAAFSMGASPAIQASETRGHGTARWIWTAGWIACSAATLGLQRAADDAFDDYRALGSPDARQQAWELARRYDRSVLAGWAASEVCFTLALRAWLRSAP
jgi:outer membrane protein assembly factor BamB